MLQAMLMLQIRKPYTAMEKQHDQSDMNTYDQKLAWQNLGISHNPETLSEHKSCQLQRPYDYKVLSN
jgi:hypothetical protein